MKELVMEAIKALFALGLAFIFLWTISRSGYLPKVFRSVLKKKSKGLTA
jgi:hypothetical protein